jgi:predicted Na+-dependent transporter
MGQKNTGLCILVTMTNFSPIAAIPATIYIIVHHLINSLLIFIYNKVIPNKETVENPDA